MLPDARESNWSRTSLQRHGDDCDDDDDDDGDPDNGGRHSYLILHFKSTIK